MRLVFITQSITPYNDSFWAALNGVEDWDLAVFVIRPGATDHPWKHFEEPEYPRRALRPRLGIDWGLVGSVLFGGSCYLISNAWYHPTSILLCLCSGVVPGFRMAFWTDTPVPGGRAGSRVRRKVRESVLGACFRVCDRVFGMGGPTRAVLAGAGLPEGRYVELPYYIDPRAYRPGPARDEGNPLVFLAAGRLVDDLKGFSVVIRAYAEATRSSPVESRLRIAGSGPDEKALRELAEEQGLRDRVEFLGWLEPDGMRLFMEEACCFVHGAAFEPYGVVILEAMASGLVVLASDGTMAAVERIVDGVNGRIHRAGDAGQLAGQMKEVLEDSEWIRAMQGAARATALEWPLERGVQTIRDVVLR